MKTLTDLDYAVLQAMDLCGEDAYGVPIRNEADKLLNRSISYGRLYGVIDFLEEEGLVVTHQVAGGPERGGRQKRICRLTPKGREVLQARISGGPSKKSVKKQYGIVLALVFVALCFPVYMLVFGPHADAVRTQQGTLMLVGVVVCMLVMAGLSIYSISLKRKIDEHDHKWPIFKLMKKQ